MKVLLFCVALFLMTATSYGASCSTDVIGLWKTAGNSSKVEIFPCGDKLCGKVVWMKNPNYVDPNDGPVGAPKFDRKNPDPALKSRPIIGLQVIEGLISAGNGSWEQGKCYDPESGNTYRCKMHLASPDHLEMRGYVGIPLFGRTYVLTR
ncbi:MAG TPA: DUF2147 domain-containing protein [Geobacteraceae bacterium]|nr:DUF2147 domain-containing protein [Geobacteraceae bacterium]